MEGRGKLRYSQMIEEFLKFSLNVDSTKQAKTFQVIFNQVLPQVIKRLQIFQIADYLTFISILPRLLQKFFGDSLQSSYNDSYNNRFEDNSTTLSNNIFELFSKGCLQANSIQEFHILNTLTPLPNLFSYFTPNQLVNLRNTQLHSQKHHQNEYLNNRVYPSQQQINFLLTTFYNRASGHKTPFQALPAAHNVFSLCILGDVRREDYSLQFRLSHLPEKSERLIRLGYFSELHSFYLKRLRYPLDSRSCLKLLSTSNASIKLSPLQFYYFNLVRAIASTNQNSVTYYGSDERHKLPMHFQWIENQVQNLLYEAKKKNGQRGAKSDKDIRIHPLTKLYLQNISYAVYEKLQSTKSKYFDLLIGLTEDYLIPQIILNQNKPKCQTNIRVVPRNPTDFLKTPSQLRVTEMKRMLPSTQRKTYDDRSGHIFEKHIQTPIERAINTAKSYKFPSLIQLECLYGLLEITSHFPNLFFQIYRKFINYFNILIYALPYNKRKQIKFADLLCIYAKLIRPWHCNPLFAFSKLDMRPNNFKISRRYSRFRKSFHDVGLVKWIFQGLFKGGVSVVHGVWNARQWFAQKRRLYQMNQKQKQQIKAKQQQINDKIQKKKNLLQEYDNSQYQRQLMNRNKFIGDPSLFCYFLLGQQQENMKKRPYDFEKYTQYAKNQSVYLCQELFYIILRKNLLDRSYNLNEIEFISMMASFLEPEHCKNEDISKDNSYSLYPQEIEKGDLNIGIFDNMISLSDMMRTPQIVRIDSTHQLCFKEMEKLIPWDHLDQYSKYHFNFVEDIGCEQRQLIQDALESEARFQQFLQNKQNNNNNSLGFSRKNKMKQIIRFPRDYSYLLNQHDKIVILQIIDKLYSISQFSTQRALLSIGAKKSKQSIEATRALARETLNKFLKLYGVANMQEISRMNESEESKRPQLKRFPSFQDEEEFEVEYPDNKALKNLDNQEVLRMQQILDRKNKMKNQRKKATIDQLEPRERAQLDDKIWWQELNRRQSQCAYQVARRCSFMCDALCKKGQIKDEKDQWKKYKRHPYTNLRCLANVSNIGLVILMVAIGFFILEFII